LKQNITLTEPTQLFLVMIRHLMPFQMTANSLRSLRRIWLSWTHDCQGGVHFQVE